MIDLALHAPSEAALAAALPWLRLGEGWRVSGPYHALDPGIAVIETPAVLDQAGEVVTPAALAEGYFANLRILPDHPDLTEIQAAAEPFRVEPATARRSFAERSWEVDNLLSYAAAKRYEVETAGIEFGGARIRTDRESQTLIGGARELAQSDPNVPICFKSESGFVTIDSAAMLMIALEVGHHVRRCFAREAEVAQAIWVGLVTAGTQVDAAFADIAAPWAP